MSASKQLSRTLEYMHRTSFASHTIQNSFRIVMFSFLRRRSVEFSKMAMSKRMCITAINLGNFATGFLTFNP